MICFIGHGVGGTNILSYISRNIKLDESEILNVSLSEQAVSIFGDSIRIRNEDITKYLDIIYPKVVINEVSNDTETQNKVIKYCRENNIPIVTVLDTYGGYEKRFTESPDFILIPFKEILTEIEDIELAATTKIIITGNPCLPTVEKHEKPHNITNPKILFVSQYLEEINYHVSQYEIYNDFKEALDRLFDSYSLKVKPHPSETLLKWDSEGIVQDKNNLYGPNEKVDVEDFDMVVGYDSTVMVQSEMLGIPTIKYENMIEGLTNFIANNRCCKPRYKNEVDAKEKILNVISEIITEVSVDEQSKVKSFLSNF